MTTGLGENMKHTLKAWGLALFAVLAMGALSASPASAGDFHSELSTDTVIKGEQIGTDVLTVNAGTVKCNEAKYTGNQSGATATTTKVTPEYTECTAFGFINTNIDSKQCTYEFSGDNNDVVIACPAGEPITVTAFNCWVTISSQTTKSTGVTYINTGAGTTRHVRSTESLEVHVVQHSKSFPGCSGGTSFGKWTKEKTTKCFSTAGAQVGCWRE